MTAGNDILDPVDRWAAVVGVDNLETSFRGGDNSGRFRLTLTAVRPADRWLVASVHIGPLQGPPAGGA
jgi:hypothetical protein